MRRVGILLVSAALLSGSACGFGLYGDSGTPNPSPNYWGWQCLDGTQPPDGGCLPQTCPDSSAPQLDGGACVCTDGTSVLPSSCQDGGAPAS